MDSERVLEVVKGDEIEDQDFEVIDVRRSSEVQHKPGDRFLYEIREKLRASIVKLDRCV